MSFLITGFIDVSYNTHNKRPYVIGNTTYLKLISSRKIQLQMHKYDTFVFVCIISFNVGSPVFSVRVSCVTVAVCISFIGALFVQFACVTGKWLSADAKVCSIKYFECALNEPLHLEVDRKLKIKIATVTEFFSVRRLP